ncbi:MAG: GNAT family N-acetyltransferase [Myxococcota bacterium]|jgi:GNAT superfamily N-acetyltransferase|nr:GNAT family N-acetyltransferase [Myxococcota bacterium]
MQNAAPFLVRPANQNDVEPIVDLWCELMAYHEALDERFTRSLHAKAKFRTFLEVNIDSENAHVLVAQAQGRIVGYTMAQESKRPPVFAVQAVVEILDMAVTSGSRGLGIGRALAKGMQSWGRQRGAKAIFLGAAAANAASNAFWAKVGARPYINLLELV